MAVPSAKQLGIASDVLSVASHGVTAGFGIARMATSTGFGIASACIRGPASALETAAGPNPVSMVLHGVDGIVGIAHTATATGQSFAQCVTQIALQGTRTGLRCAGAEEGELLRLTVGSEAAEALQTVNMLARELAGPSGSTGMTPQQFLLAMNAWAAMQRAAGDGDSPPAGIEPIVTMPLPEHSERWLRFAAATFGHVWLAGLLDGATVDGFARGEALRRAGGHPGEAALACAGVHGKVEVIAFEQSTRELFAPGYLVAVDYEVGAVVVALRGTSSVTDALTDLFSRHESLELGGHAGSAHSGMLRAARRLEGPLAGLALQGLQRLATAGGRPRIVLSGHSLGAGVAALVAALWRDGARFAGVDVKCMAFACPQVLDSELAAAQSNHTTSVVLGDDLVPRFSFATAQDLRNVALMLTFPEQHGLPANFSAAEILAAESRGGVASLAAAYGAVRPLACTSSGRLFPAGAIVHLSDGGAAWPGSQQALDELRISGDMASSHMPRRYLLAVQAVTARL